MSRLSQCGCVSHMKNCIQTTFKLPYKLFPWQQPQSWVSFKDWENLYTDISEFNNVIPPTTLMKLNYWIRNICVQMVYLSLTVDERRVVQREQNFQQKPSFTYPVVVIFSQSIDDHSQHPCSFSLVLYICEYKCISLAIGKKD